MTDPKPAPTIDDVVSALKAHVGRWDSPVIFLLDGKMLTLDSTMLASDGDGEERPDSVLLEYSRADGLPNVQHLWYDDEDGVMVPWCGDQRAVPWTPETTEESNSVPVCALCHKRSMHFKSDERDAALAARATAVNELVDAHASLEEALQALRALRVALAEVAGE